MGDDHEARIPVRTIKSLKFAKSGCATRPDVRPNTHAVGSDSILVRHLWGSGVSQVLTVFVQEENRAHRSLCVTFDQEGDTPQDVVKGCADENHLERIKHRLAG